MRLASSTSELANALGAAEPRPCTALVEIRQRALERDDALLGRGFVRRLLRAGKRAHCEGRHERSDEIVQ